MYFVLGGIGILVNFGLALVYFDLLLGMWGCLGD